MKLFVAVAALATIAVVYTHPGSERVKRQSSSSSAGASGGNGFAFSGGLPFGDLFSTFPGFDQGLFSRSGSPNTFNPMLPRNIGDYNGAGTYNGYYNGNNGYYTGNNGYYNGNNGNYPGYNGYYNGYGGFNGASNSLGGFGTAGYNNNEYTSPYNNNRYAPTYTSSSSFASPGAVPDVGLFSRISPVAPVYSSLGGGPGVSSSYSSSSSNGNGGQITFSESNIDGYRTGQTTQVDPTGRITTYQHGSGGPETISTRVLQPGQSRGVYSASGVTNNNGNVSSYRTGGSI